ncbi:MAG: carbohydrate ABC transporter permease [Acidimicrobiales bacterium]
MSSRIGRGLVFTVLTLLGISTVYPLLFMALNSMRTSQAFEVNPFGLPSHISFGSYSSLFQQVPFLQSILHSLIVVVPAVLLATFASSLAAFVFTKVPIKLGNVLFWTMLMIMFMPGVVVLLPLYVEVARTGLSNNFAPAMLVYTAINIPYGTYLLRSNFRAIPNSVVEAARVDGASWFKVYWRVIVPIGKPGIITVAILTFLNIWNDLFVSLVLLHQPNTEMVTPTLAELSGKFTSDIPVLMAGLLLGALPTLLLYAVTARVFIRGMLSGAVR